ncbi:hypothetical protein A8H39_01925 [Paraburkholderia fungorum]|uniref:SPFH domain-containing protein n=1 Tax=Paraburkholderia fungorum TaxID=134537 RepID=UPI000489FC82|nr:SPFH domain-containing protein [Paraburkholderia fungorum]PNE59930.1 hypothetical protein A8H39_01925 [Paraburkholderia fungorum]
MRIRTIPLFLAAAALAASCLSGCTRIETGNVGIVKHWGGSIDPIPVDPGFHLTLFKTITEVDATLTRVPVEGLVPKDAKGVPLNDVDIVVTYKLNPAGVSKFYASTKEIDDYRDESGNTFQTLGLYLIRSKAPHVMQEVTSRDEIINLSRDLTAYERQASEEFKHELDAQYPGAFESVVVQVNKFQLPDSVQKQVNDMAGMDAERMRNQQEIELAEQRTQLAEKNAIVDAMALRQAADAARLTPEQIIEWKRAQASMVQAQNIGTATKVANVAQH